MKLSFRHKARPRLLVSAFGALNGAAIVLIVLAPGVPSFYDTSSAKATALTEALVVAFLLRGSRIAWWFGLFLTAGAVPLCTLSALSDGAGRFRFDPKAMCVALLEAAAVVVLTSPALERSLGRKRLRSVRPST
jgi:hypothetical protein